MRNYLVHSLSILGGVSLLAVSCLADTINVASSAAETSNNSANATMAVTPDPRWANAFAGSEWISYVNSGDIGGPGFVSPPNGTSVIFTDTFTINGTPTGGTVNVLADDSTSVTLNGVLLMPLAPTSGNTYTICSDVAIGCLAKTEAIVNLSSALKSGVNTLSFDVVQENAQDFGLDYAGSIDFTPATVTPEPGTFVLLGISLFGLGGARRFKIGTTRGRPNTFGTEIRKV